MLNIMRKYSSSWLIKLPLFTIILSFILYFGYNSLRSTPNIDQVTAISVNGIETKNAFYQYIYNRTIDQYKKSFEGKEIPEFILNYAKKSAHQQIVSRTLALHMADKMDAVVSDDELRHMILETLKPLYGDSFNYDNYVSRFLPSFEMENKFNFEPFLRDDVQIQKIYKLLSSIDTTMILENTDLNIDNETWTFQAIKFPEKILTDKKIIKADDDIVKLANKLIKLPTRKWKRFIKKNHLEIVDLQPISIAQRKRLPTHSMSQDDMSALFQLIKKDDIFSKAIASNKDYYVYRLMKYEKKDPTSKEIPGSAFYNAWLRALSNQARIQINNES